MRSPWRTRFEPRCACSTFPAPSSWRTRPNSLCRPCCTATSSPRKPPCSCCSPQGCNCPPTCAGLRWNSASCPGISLTSPTICARPAVKARLCCRKAACPTISRSSIRKPAMACSMQPKTTSSSCARHASASRGSCSACSARSLPAIGFMCCSACSARWRNGCGREVRGCCGRHPRRSVMRCCTVTWNLTSAQSAACARSTKSCVCLFRWAHAYTPACPRMRSTVIFLQSSPKASRPLRPW